MNYTHSKRFYLYSTLTNQGGQLFNSHSTNINTHSILYVQEKKLASLQLAFELLW